MEFLNHLFTALFELRSVRTMTVHYSIALTTAALVFVLIALWSRSRVLGHTTIPSWQLYARSSLAWLDCGTMQLGTTVAHPTPVL